MQSICNFPILITLTALVLAVATVPSSAAAAPDTDSVPFVSRTVTTSTGTFKFAVYVPSNWSKTKKWPVIMFLNGWGERGSDGMLQTKAGIRHLIADNPAPFPCVVVCPQCQNPGWWTMPAMEEIALKALDQSIAEFNGDTRRLYLTGLSMGGFETWKLAQEYPERWAAIAPCCGGIKPLKGLSPDSDFTDPDLSGDVYFAWAKKIAGIPVWAFHGEADPTVPTSETRQMVAILMSMKADVRYTEYPGVGHDSWDNAYSDPGLLPWLLSHKLSK